MSEAEFQDRLTANPFVPFRVHLVSGKTVDVLAPGTAWTLNQTMLILRSPTADRAHAEGYDLLSYGNIERLEQLPIGKRPTGKRKLA